MICVAATAAKDVKTDGKTAAPAPKDASDLKSASGTVVSCPSILHRPGSCARCAGDVDPLKLLQEDCKDDDYEQVITSINRLATVATALGAARTRNELLPYLLEFTEQDNDEAQTAIARQLGDFVEVSIPALSACPATQAKLFVILLLRAVGRWPDSGHCPAPDPRETGGRGGAGGARRRMSPAVLLLTTLLFCSAR